MRGYKALNKGLINRYGFQYELGKKYVLIGELKWGKNGFHFCSRPEDTLRYVDSWNDEIDIVEIEGNGDLILYEDEYYGYYDMYCSSEMTLNRIISREEMFNMIINSHDEHRVKRLAQSLELTDDEIRIIRYNYDIESTLDYYQDKNNILTFKKQI